MAQLQLALDFLDLAKAVEMACSLQECVDIVEVGTPMIVDHGLRAVREIRASLPDTQMLADLKIMDAGFQEAEAAFRSGADIVTVLGVAGENTIAQVVKAARKYEGKRVLADLIECHDVGQRTSQLVDLGVDIVCVHTAFDSQKSDQKKNPLEEPQSVRRSCPQATVAVAGGVTLETAAAIAAQGARIVVIGSAITGAPDPLGVAKAMRKILKECI